MTLLQRHRGTWPAEWLRRHGREEDAEQWIRYYVANAKPSTNGAALQSEERAAVT
jgi:hypothetical protein